MATFLVPWVMYLCGVSFENVDICYYININSASFHDNMIDLQKNIGTSFAPHSFCINDVENKNKIDTYNKIKNYMEHMFN